MSKKHRGQIKGDPVTYQTPLPAGGVQLETFLPWTLVHRGFKKQVITPLDAPQEFLDEALHEQQVREMRQDTPLMRALGLAHHWQRLLDEGRFGSMTEIAVAEGIDLGQASKMSRLAQLAPDLIEAIAFGRLEVGISQLLQGKLSASWLLQRESLLTSLCCLSANCIAPPLGGFYVFSSLSVAPARASENTNLWLEKPRRSTTLCLEYSRGKQRTERKKGEKCA